MDKKIDQLLPWYANGSLVGPDRNRLEEALARDDAARDHLRWETAVRESIQADPLYDIAPDRGLEQVMQRIRAEAPAPAAPVRQQAPSRKARVSSGDGVGFMERLREWFSPKPALAVAFTLVAVQFAVIGQMWSTRGEEGSYSDNRALASAAQRGDAFIRVLIKPETTERQLSQMLRANNAEIVAGPTQLGEYYLLVKPSDAPQVLTRFLTNNNIESAEIVNALPTRP